LFRTQTVIKSQQKSYNFYSYYWLWTLIQNLTVYLHKIKKHFISWYLQSTHKPLTLCHKIVLGLCILYQLTWPSDTHNFFTLTLIIRGFFCLFIIIIIIIIIISSFLQNHMLCELCSSILWFTYPYGNYVNLSFYRPNVEHQNMTFTLRFASRLSHKFFCKRCWPWSNV
jgi:hypothetical protein